MLASVTPLPVIGVPVPLRYLDGMDSLLSIVQMPGGVPVATVGVGNAKNAGLLAARILGASDEAIRQKLVDYQASLSEVAKEKGAGVFKRFQIMRRWLDEERLPFAHFLSGDGLHLNDFGYRCIGRIFGRAIERAVRQ